MIITVKCIKRDDGKSKCASDIDYFELKYFRFYLIIYFGYNLQSEKLNHFFVRVTSSPLFSLYWFYHKLSITYSLSTNPSSCFILVYPAISKVKLILIYYFFFFWFLKHTHTNIYAHSCVSFLIPNIYCKCISTRHIIYFIE